MDLLARIAALIAPLAPALGLQLLARFFAGFVLDRLQKSMQQADALTDPAARRVIITRHMRAHHMLLCIAERLAVLALWMLAQAKCGRVILCFQFDIPEMTISPPPGAISARLASLARRLDRIGADADALTAQWERAKHTAATLPPLAGEVRRSRDGGESQGDSLNHSPCRSPPSTLRATSPASGGRAHLCFAARGPPAPTFPHITPHAPC